VLSAARRGVPMPGPFLWERSRDAAVRVTVWICFRVVTNAVVSRIVVSKEGYEDGSFRRRACFPYGRSNHESPRRGNLCRSVLRTYNWSACTTSASESHWPYSDSLHSKCLWGAFSPLRGLGDRHRARSFIGCSGQLVTFGGSLGLYRLGVQFADAEGVIVRPPGLVAYSQTLGGLGAITAGQTWSFQCWYRDIASPCGITNNLSNGLSVQFVP